MPPFHNVSLPVLTRLRRSACLLSVAALTLLPVRGNAADSGSGGNFFSLGAALAHVGAQLANEGIYLNGYYSGTLFGEASGGTKHTTIYYNDINYGASFDLHKLLGLPGASIEIDFDSRYGGIPQSVNNLSGSAMDTLNGVGPEGITSLTEFFYQQNLLNDRLEFIVGRTQLANYFGTSELYCQFIGAVCSNLGPFNWSADSNAPFWPVAVWAGMVTVKPNKQTYLRIGASEDDPYEYSSGGYPWNGGWSTRHATGVYVPVELGYKTDPATARYAGRYDVGFYYDSSNFADPRLNAAGRQLALAGGQPALNGSQTVVYGQVEQMVWRPDPKKPQGLWAFGGALFNTSGRALVQTYYQAGLVLKGTFPGRPDDSLGLLGTYDLFNPRFTGALTDKINAAGGNGRMSRTEAIMELNYGLQLAPGVTFKPYANLTVDPDQNLYNIPVPNPRLHYGLAVGAQLFIGFNDALGLPFFNPS